MWQPVAADVTFSISSGWSGGSKSSLGKPSSGNDLHHDMPSVPGTRTRSTSAGLDSKDRGLDSSGGCDVINTDSDSGAIDASELTTSVDVCVSPDNQCPDDGYGWVVVLASFLNAFIIDGVGSCYGLVYPHVMEKYGASASAASFAGSLFNALLVMGSVSVMLVKRYGYRRVTMSGGVLACLSFILSTRSPNVVCFVLTYGLFTGCACGLVFLPSIVIVNSYFHKKRGLANGIITSGSGAGLLVLAQLVNYLLEEFSLDSALLVLAGVLLNTCVFSCLYRPPGQLAPTSAKQADQEISAPLTPGSGSTDSGLLVSASLSPSIVSLASVKGGLGDSFEGKYGGNGEETAAEGVLEHTTSYSQSGWVGTENDQDKYENKASSGLEQREHWDSAHDCRSLQCRSLLENVNADNNKVLETDKISDELLGQETALLGRLCSEKNPQRCVSTFVGHFHIDQSKETRTESSNRLSHNGCLCQPSESGINPHQLWVSTHNIPTQPAAWRPHAMHSSAYDVTQWSATSTHRDRAARGLVPLSDRFSFLRNPRCLQQSRSCHNHCQIIEGQNVPTHGVQHSNPSCSCYPHHREHHIDHQLRSRHHRHGHLTCRLSELDQGSNLYLAGSISTLRNLQAKHILHLTTSQDAGQFSSPEALLVPDSRGSKSQLSQDSVAHLSPTSKSHASDSGLHIPELHAHPAKGEISSHFLPSEDKTFSVYHTANTDAQKNFFPFSSKQSLEARFALSMTEPNLSVGERSFQVDEELAGSKLHLEDTSQSSLEVTTSGYSLSELLRMPCFHLFCVGSCLIQIGYPIPSIFLADLAYHQGLSTTDTTIIMGVMGGLNIAGRLLSGLLANLGVNPLRLLYTSLLFGGLACLLAPLYTTFWSLVLFAGMFGFLLGAFPPVQPLVIVEYFGLDSLASVFGLLTTIKGASSMLGPPLAGLVYDASGQYSMSFMFGGVVFLLSAAVHLAMPLFRPK